MNSVAAVATGDRFAEGVFQANDFPNAPKKEEKAPLSIGVGGEGRGSGGLRRGDGGGGGGSDAGSGGGGDGGVPDCCSGSEMAAIAGTFCCGCPSTPFKAGLIAELRMMGSVDATGVCHIDDMDHCSKIDHAKWYSPLHLRCVGLYLRREAPQLSREQDP